MRKIINSETEKYQEVTTDSLVLDDKPNLNSFNGITSDAVARAVAGASGEVPQVTETDNGKVLTAIYDAGGPAVDWRAAPEVDEVPAVGELNNGMVLTASYSEGEGSYGWGAVPAGNGRIVPVAAGTASFADVKAVIDAGNIPYITTSEGRIALASGWTTTASEGMNSVKFEECHFNPGMSGDSLYMTSRILYDGVAGWGAEGLYACDVTQLH